jgi:hypothetical protein
MSILPRLPKKDKGQASIEQPATKKAGFFSRIKTGLAERKAKKAAKAQAQPAPAKQKTVKGITGYSTPKSDLSKFDKEKTGHGGAIAGIFILIAIIIFVAQFIGAIPRMPFSIVIFFELILLIFGIITAIILKVAKTSGAAIGATLFVIIALSIISGWLTTPYGQEISGAGGRTGIEAGQQLKVVGGELNVFGQVLQGTYDPNNLWRSDTVQSEYSEVKDVGVRLLDVRPLRDEFFIGQQLSIQGRIDAVSFPKSAGGVSVSLSACSMTGALADVCPEGGKEAWICCVSSACSDFTTVQLSNIKDARNRVFSCTHDPLSKQNLAYPVEISVKAQGTSTMAGKQFVYADTNALLALPSDTDPLKAFDISRDSVRSWQVGDDALEVGLGVAGDPDVLETGELEYFLGVNIENPATHIGSAKIDSVELFLPTSAPDLKAGGEDFLSCTSLSTQDKIDLNIQNAAVINLKKCKNIVPDILEPGDRVNKFIKVKITSDQLVNQEFSTFFVLARVKFDYENKQTIPLIVRELYRAD